MLRKSLETEDVLPTNHPHAGWGWKVLLTAVLLLGLGACLNYPLTHQGLPMGRKRIFAPWFRGSVTYRDNYGECFFAAKDAGVPRTLIPFADPVRLELFYFDVQGSGGGAEGSALELNSEPLMVPTPQLTVRLRRWLGFFVLER